MQEKTKAVILTKNLIPYPTTFGTAIQAWSFAKTLINRGYEVHLCCFAFDSSIGKMEWAEQGVKPVFDLLESEGIKVHLIDKKETGKPAPKKGKWATRFDLIQSMIAPNYEDLFETDTYQADISRLITEISPEFICAWSAHALSALDEKLPYPKIAITTDLIHLARRYRRQMNPNTTLREKWYQFADEVSDRKLVKLTIEQLKQCDLVFNHASHHAQWLCDKGLASTKYFPIPVLDQAGKDWAAKRTMAHDEDEPFRILLVGNVTGVATLSGLYFLANEVIPELEQLLKSDDYEIHIVGGGKLRPELLEKLTKSNIKLRGYVDDIETEYLQSDVFLVPTTIELGFRTRISEAFSYGCCVIAHSSNQLGMPELNHGENCLISSTGKEMVKAIFDCYQSEELRKKLRNTARETYEKKLDGAFVCNNMVDAIEEVVGS